jgi:CHAT domain-containing protein
MRQVQLLSEKHTDGQAAAAEGEINNLTAEYQQVEAAIRARSPAYAALTQPRPLTAAEVQKQVLDPNTLLLEYVLADEGSFLWTVTQTSLSIYKLPRRTDVESAARWAYHALSDAAGTDNAALAELSRMVLGPVAGQLGSARLVVVADGALHFVPFAALPSPGSGKPLVVEHEVVSLPSASTLAEQRRELAGRRTAPRTVAVLADPVFDGSDPRVSGGRHTIRPNEQLTRSAAETGFGGFPRLSASRREADGIAALAPPGRSLEALDFDASRATATSDALSQYRIVHFATHGLLNAQHPELSGIVLSLVNRKGEPDNGFLQAHEMYNLKLGADLVVMSACQTALGKEVQGEGLVGLTRGLMYAGAARVVASLWRVPDVATAELMKRFYKGMLVDGLRPAAALRQAQVSIWQDGRWARPYYWAAFTMQGDWR